MNRRHFLAKSTQTCGAIGAFFGGSFANFALASSATNYKKLLVLVELKGANDGLNTVIPYAAPAYATLRPNIAIKRDQVLQLNDSLGFHPALEPLMPLWKDKQLAIVNGIGYPQPNLSHFRSIEIWDTASRSDEYKNEGWLTRLFNEHPAPKSYAADGIIVGSSDLGPLNGGARAVALQSVDAYLRQAKLADPHGRARNAALQHILKVEQDVTQSAQGIAPQISLKTEFPNSGLGSSVKTAMHVVAGSPGVAVVRVTLGGFDTHNNQLGTHQGLLKQLADGLVALKAALIETNRWNDTLIMTYCEFGRRAKENLSNGTDHGTANVQFALGGAVKGGLYGQMPSLTALNGDGNVSHTVDYRAYYASALTHWGVGTRDSEGILGGKFAPIGFA